VNHTADAVSGKESGSIRQFVSTLWCELLDVAAVKPSDDFFALGGHSLLALRMLFRLRQYTDIEIPLACLFDSADLADFSARIEAMIQAGAGKI
jgi:acyl carrier protein